MKRRFCVGIVLLLLATGCDGQQETGGDREPEGGGTTEAATAEATQRTTGETTAADPEETTVAPPQPELEVREVVIRASGDEEVVVQAEVADDPDEQSWGLMGRTSLGEDRGMLFVFPDEQIRSFWMRGTLIPLSIAYIDSEGRVVDIQDMEPLDDDPPSYVSAEPAQYALEVNRGFFDERGVEVGDRAELPD